MEVTINLRQKEVVEYLNLATQGIIGMRAAIAKLNLPPGHDVVLLIMSAKLLSMEMEQKAKEVGGASLDGFYDLQRQVHKAIAELVYFKENLS